MKEGGKWRRCCTFNTCSKVRAVDEVKKELYLYYGQQGVGRGGGGGGGVLVTCRKMREREEVNEELYL